MSTISFLHFTDLHLRDSNPPSRRGNYANDMMDKLAWIGVKGSELGVDVYTDGGDTFHFKKASATSHYLVNRTMAVFQSYQKPVLTIEGNHDLDKDRVDKIHEQPIETLIRGGAMVHLREYIVEKDGFRVRFAGFDYTEDHDLSGYFLTDEDRAKADKHVVVLHMYASKNGGTLHGTKIFSYEELAGLGYDVYCFGHYHIDQGIIENERGQIFVNIGSLSRGDYGDTALTRIPRVGYVQLGKNGISYEAIEVAVAKPGSEVFDIEKYNHIEAQGKEVEKYVENLKEAFVAPVVEDGKDAANESRDLDSEISNLDTDKFSASVIALARTYLKEAESEIAASCQ